MKNLTNIILLCFLLLSGLSGQAQEMQVSIDSANTRLVIDKFLSEKLGLYTEYESFEKAWIFQKEEGVYVLEIYHYKDKVLHRDVRIMGEQEYRVYSAMVAALIQEKVKKVSTAEPAELKGELDQSGRTTFIVNNAIVSLGYYGWAVPSMIDLENFRPAFAVYLLTASAGFFLPLAITRDSEVTPAESNLNLLGITRGILHGFAIVSLIDPEFEDSNPFLFAGLAASVGEGVAGYHIAKNNNLTPGNTGMIGVMGDASFGAGLVLSTLIDPSPRDIRLPAASALIGTGIGMYAGYKLSQTQSYSLGDARVTRIGQIATAYLPLGFLFAFGGKDLALETEGEVRLYAASALVGAVGGTILSHRITQDYDYTASQGTLIQLGSLATGGLLAGVTFLASPDEEARPLLLASGLGTMGGFLLLTHLFKQRGLAERDGEAGAFYWQFHPESLWASKLMPSSDANPRPGIPALSLGWRF